MFPNLELEMFKAKVTTRELAEKCGICESAMRNKITGRRPFKLEEVESLLKFFSDCDWTYLFARKDKGKAG